MFLGTLRASLLQNLLATKGINNEIPEREVIKASEVKIRGEVGTIKARQDF